MRTNHSLSQAQIEAKKLVDEIVAKEPRLQRVRENRKRELERLCAERARIDAAIAAAAPKPENGT